MSAFIASKRFLRRFRINCLFKLIGLVLFFICLIIVLSSVQLSNDKQKDDMFGQFQMQKKDKTYKFLVILLLSAPKSHDVRDIIRATWWSESASDVGKFFAIGAGGLDSEFLEKLHAENVKYGDLILLPTVHDSYKNLTTKLKQTFVWAEKSLNFRFLFKGDDDTFVRIDMLYKELQSQQSTRLYWGFFDGRARVKQTGQWAEEKWVLCDRYLPHARGGGYVLSSDLVRYIALNADLLQTFNSEDVSVGAWLGPLDVQRIHDPRFDTEYKSRGCNNEYIVTHKQSADMMQVLHKSLKNKGKLCRSEFRTRLSYVYDWNAVPSLCCIRNNSAIP